MNQESMEVGLTGINIATTDPIEALAPEPGPVADINTALQLFRDGAVAQGMALYRRVLFKAENAYRLPIGLHLTFLQNLNLPQAAAELREVALRAGGNPCISANLNAPAERQITEYRGLIAQGTLNAVVISGYLEVLNRVGEFDEMVRILAPEQKLRLASLSAPGFAGDWPGLTDAILALKSERSWQEAEMSVRKMHTIKKLESMPQPIIQELLTAIRHQTRETIEQRIAETAGDPDPMTQWLPQDWKLSTWAIISEGGGGHNTRHIHPRGWLTGLVYIACEGCAGADAADGSEAGALKIGAPTRRIGQPGWPDITIHPQPGLFVLMPSYYTHWTVPIDRPGLRIAVAFDVVDAKD